jgi:sulfur-oxidizing protein SoxA
MMRAPCPPSWPGAAIGSLAVAAIALLSSPAFAEIPLSERRSGYEMMSRETRAMQDDDTSNPATLTVLDGEALWQRKAGNARKACADCHGEAAQSMRGVAARYPAFSPANGRPINIEQRINLCRTGQQQAAPLAYESRDLLALTAFVGRQSRGMPIAVAEDEKTRPFIEAGRKTYSTRQGQLNLSCRNCHDDNWGQKLAGIAVPQAHPTGYPLYRLEWQSIGSLQRRLRNCMIGMRAEPYAYGADENVDLELFLMWRARGMNVDTPAVRP